MTVEQTLRTLQHTARQKPIPHQSRHLLWKLPDDLATEDTKSITLYGATCDLVDELVATLPCDQRFEHMGEPEKTALRFVADASQTL